MCIVVTSFVLISSLQNPGRRDLVLGLELPVLAVDDWLPVNDLDSSHERGQIRVTLAAGRDVQIRQLMPHDLVRTSTDDQERDETLKVEDEDEEHLYDTVHEESLEHEEEEHKDTPGSTTSSTTPLVDPSSSSEESLPSQEEAPRQPFAHPSPHSQFIPKRTTVSHPELPTQRPVPDPAVGKDGKKFFKIQLSLEEARNLPRVYDPVRQDRVPPSTYLTFTGSAGSKTVRTNCIHVSSHPQWAFRTVTEISSEILTDPRKHFILKLWHHPNTGRTPVPEDVDLETDHVVGFVAIDLSPLRSGFPQICGWYNIMDFVGRCRGQVKVTVKPLMSPEEVRSLPTLPYLARRESINSFVCEGGGNGPFIVETRYQRFPSHIVQHTEQIISPRESPVLGSNPQEMMVVETSISPEEKRSQYYEEQRDFGRKMRRDNNYSDSITTTTTATNVSTVKEISRSKAKTRFWNPPLPQSLEGGDDPSKSMLERKMTDLEESTKKLKEKLRLAAASNTRNVTPTAAAAGKEGMMASKDFSELTLEELQSNIDSQLKRIEQQQNQRNRDKEDGEKKSEERHYHSQENLEEGEEEPAAARNFGGQNEISLSSANSSFAPSSTFPAADVSAEICEVLSSDDTNDVSDSQIEAMLPQLRRTTLRDLNIIDWSQVLEGNSSSNSWVGGGGGMRDTPEGGNPQDQTKI